jgi:hypothetical protein
LKTKNVIFLGLTLSLNNGPVIMALDLKDWRPITFQGVTFPATLMGSSVLDPIFGIEDEDLAEWLMLLTVCCGVTKSAPSERCARCAERLLDLMLEQRQHVLEGIRDCLASHGFDAVETYRDWIMAFQQIIKLSMATDGDCFWSAPLHPDDRYKSAADVKRFMKSLDRSHQIYRRRPKPDK